MKNMKERPILFSTHMVQALLRGEKTQTRRIMKPQYDYVQMTEYGLRGGKYIDESGNITGEMDEIKCPYGQIGDVLWVRETFMYDYTPDGVIYKADVDEQSAKHMNWKPSIFMPRDACRIKLEITDIRVERVNEISEQDAIAEGIEIELPEPISEAELIELREEYGKVLTDTITFRDYSIDEDDNEGFNYFLTAKESYKSLWESINGKESWSSNPYVWVIEFRRVM